MKIGFIGAGNMAQAIIKGLVASETVTGDAIYLTTSTVEHSQEVAGQLGVHALASNEELAKTVDYLILAVKPGVIPTVLTDLSAILSTKDLPIISIAAGLTLADLANLVPTNPQQKFIRVMPNMNVTVRMGVSAITANTFVEEQETFTAQTIFDAVGSTYLIAEKDFRNFTSLAGCSPAYTYLFIDAMSRAGVKNGLPKALATKIATEAVMGSAALLSATEDETPWDLIDKVCSPGGTTVAGLVSLEEDAFTATVIRALDATIKRDEEMTK
ncbi:pyrroline-5-carboxylate reductase [Vagococcus coleopterorum]|uniref:Pyrroline-5-carboxylate reductase n=1 Tax=Vagococcus coleopterorum TaxID=2714946 RepID=A0A6G8AL22_9ENTE|nr:pyrroline-5-carboxylate reductase [Vagococcus coleopterorum]QIL45687.1 pyrroline-5-carboxylate reductase [Vagococcus coleopterorum]